MPKKNVLEKLSLIVDKNWPTDVELVTAVREPTHVNIHDVPDFFRLVFSIYGGQPVECPLDNGSFTVDFSVGKALIISPKSWVFADHLNKKFHNIVIRLRGKFIDVMENNNVSWPNNQSLFSLPIKAQSPEIKELKELFTKAVKVQPENRLIARRYCALIVAIVKSMIEKESQKKTVLSLQDAVDFVTHNFNRKITINSLSERFSVSSARINPFFKEKVGMNFRDYLLNCRMKMALSLIYRSSLQQREVARICGYSNYQSFIHAFTRVYGSPPQKMHDYMHSTGTKALDSSDMPYVAEILPIAHLETTQIEFAESQESYLHLFNLGDQLIKVDRITKEFESYHLGTVRPNDFQQFRIALGTVVVIKSITEKYLGCLEIKHARSMAFYNQKEKG